MLITLENAALASISRQRLPNSLPKVAVDLVELKGSAATKHAKSHMAKIIYKMYQTRNANGSKLEWN